ncbi:hypothetical protein HJC23_011312 [Cyclotella cryptica]|uniref:High light inducible protein n=1 Tax=Cyclotella cryptica TaxID=29204 RepID=A0ABD3QVE1_9STRA|eukprot:CCRYP_001708-RA/>CCRYP_001708-RA protein AED:0.11 eAED:0.11 QI:166/1/1/1/0/0/2/425/186
MMKISFILATLTVSYSSAFSFPGHKTTIPRPTLTRSQPIASSSSLSASPESPAQSDADVDDGPRMNPDNPALPELKGDYDWDAEFAEDPDWITENVPGKIVLNELELAAQATALSKLEEGYRKERLAKEYEEARIIGFVPQAEMYNGRFAMFFLVVGLLTELWTGISIPGQIEEMARVGGFIGPDF